MSESNRNESLPDEDSSDDGLWNEFETCATSGFFIEGNEIYNFLSYSSLSKF